LEEKDSIIENLEAKIVTLRKYVQQKNMQNNSKVLDNIINSQRPHHEKSGLGYNQTKEAQDPKLQIKKHNQEDMQRQSEETRSFTGKITRTLLHLEDLDFKISDIQKQVDLMKKKDLEE
jgi:hypothetical protein